MTPTEKKKFNLGKIEISMETNGYAKGIVLKREPTVRETMYILSNILGFAVDDYKEWFDDKEERQDFLKDCQSALTKYLKGECDYSHLCNETQCYDDDEIGFPIAFAFPLASYLQKKGIISPTEQRPTEDERKAYEFGYQRCCRDNGIPYVGIRDPFEDKNILAFHIEITDKVAEYLFPHRTDELAKYITKKIEEGYEKFKRGEPLD